MLWCAIVFRLESALKEHCDMQVIGTPRETAVILGISFEDLSAWSESTNFQALPRLLRRCRRKATGEEMFKFICGDSHLDEQIKRCNSKKELQLNSEKPKANCAFQAIYSPSSDHHITITLPFNHAAVNPPTNPPTNPPPVNPPCPGIYLDPQARGCCRLLPSPRPPPWRQ